MRSICYCYNETFYKAGNCSIQFEVGNNKIIVNHNFKRQIKKMVINKQFPRCIRQILFAIIALFEIYVGHINEVTGIQNHLIHDIQFYDTILLYNWKFQNSKWNYYYSVVSTANLYKVPFELSHNAVNNTVVFFLIKWKIMSSKM